MKKVILASAVALFSMVSAQTEKGSWVVGGSTTLGFNNVSTKVKANGQSQDGPKISTFTLTPSVGYFVADKIAVGLDLGFTSLTNKEDDSKVTLSTLSIMPTATYYFKNDSKVIPYLGAGVGYANTTTKYSVGSVSEEDTTDGLAWKAKGGLVYMISPSVGLDLGLSYNQVSNKETYSSVEFKNTTSTFGVNAGFSFFFK